MSTHTQDREETIYRLAIEGWPLADIRAILRYSATVQQLAVEACNRELTERELSVGVRAEARIREVVMRNGCSPRFGGDPRGYCVKVALPSGSYNTWGGKEDGWGIPAKG